MKLIILDRDGVINQDSDNYIRSPEEWIPVPGSIEAIAQLAKAGFTIAVATNQSGIGRGYYDLDTLQAMHTKMLSLVEAAGGHIACIKFCPHLPEDNCDCRKPGTGLVKQIEEHLSASARGGWFVGDTLKDLQVGQRCGCHTALVRTGKGQRTLDNEASKSFIDSSAEPVSVFNNLWEFSQFLLKDKECTY